MASVYLASGEPCVYLDIGPGIVVRRSRHCSPVTPHQDGLSGFRASSARCRGGADCEQAGSVWTQAQETALRYTQRPRPALMTVTEALD